MTLAFCDSICTWRIDGSSRAMTCPLLHDRVEVGVEFLHDARDLGADIDGRHRLERAGRLHALDHVAARHRHGRHRRFGPGAILVVGPATRAGRREDDYKDDQLFHDVESPSRGL